MHYNPGSCPLNAKVTILSICSYMQGQSAQDTASAAAQKASGVVSPPFFPVLNKARPSSPFFHLYTHAIANLLS